MPAKPVLSVRLDPEMLSRVEEYAGDRNRTDAVNELLERGLACA